MCSKMILAVAAIMVICGSPIMVFGETAEVCQYRYTLKDVKNTLERIAGDLDNKINEDKSLVQIVANNVLEMHHIMNSSSTCEHSNAEEFNQFLQDFDNSTAGKLFTHLTDVADIMADKPRFIIASVVNGLVMLLNLADNVREQAVGKAMDTIHTLTKTLI